MSLTPSQVEDLRLAASKMTGASRRAFQAQMTIKYCEGSARKAERLFGWGRRNVQLGLEERRSGIICVGLQSSYSGAKQWEELFPEAAQALREIAEAHAQQEPSFKTSIAFTRLTAAEAIAQLRSQGFEESQIPAPSTMAIILNRMGYRLRKVLKAKPQKKIPETDAIFENISIKDQKNAERVKRLSLDCKATVKIGDYDRGGKTRGYNQAQDHDMGAKEKYIPCGILDEDIGQLYLNFGSSYKTSDFIVDSLSVWWSTISPAEKQQIDLIQIKVDNGPENSGIRTQFLKRMVEFTNKIGKSIQLLYFPPYHSKYNPIERCWGILEQHWNGALFSNRETMLSWAKTMKWKGIQPIVHLSQKIYQKGISLTKKAMEPIEMRLLRHPHLPKWDILIRPG